MKIVYFTLFLFAISLPKTIAQTATLKNINLNNKWEMRQAGQKEWVAASVPGNVHMDLLRNNKIPDPFYGKNEKDLQWIEKENWEYQQSFNLSAQDLSSENATLLFEGLDTYAKVTLNGKLILTANNMFRAWEVSVKPYLKQGNNTLHILFESPIVKTLPTYDSLDFKYPANNDQAEKKVSIFTRKAGYHYGWDWGPRFVTSGIWRPVNLLLWNKARITDVQIIQHALKDNEAFLTVRITVDASTSSNLTFQINSSENTVEKKSKVISLQNGISTHDLQFYVTNPELWWPNGLGKQKLYPLDISILEQGVSLHKKSISYGLRTLEVVHKDDSLGKSFFVKINGHPVFMKGANYIPSDNFVNRVDEKKYEMLLNSAVDANMNMLRVWGGGIYESDKFYELCDKKGILVWQDFMFGCSMYPADAAFVNNVKEEAIYNVRRIRNHPCLTLWCGNNENETAWFHWGWQKQFGWTQTQQDKMWNDYKKIFHELLPQICAVQDSGRFYHRSSPSANSDVVRPDTLGFGDKHYWGVWHAEEPYRNYEKNISRFMSEYGFQSFPELKTVKTYAEPKDFNIESDVMLFHQRHPRGNQLIKEYMSRDYQTPKNFESFLYAGQVLQAEIIKFAAESHRRAMPYNMGSLYWQLNDCWPVASWSGMDYYGRWKAQHYFASKFFNPLLISVVNDKDTIKCFVISDKLKSVNAKITLQLLDFNGKELWNYSKDAAITPNASKVYYQIPNGQLLKNHQANNVVLRATLNAENKMLSSNYFYFVPPKDLLLPKVKCRWNLEGSGQEYTLTVNSDVLAKNVCINAATIDLKLSDNYFDLLPKENKKIKISLQKAILKADLEKQISIVTLRDSY